MNNQPLSMAGKRLLYKSLDVLIGYGLSVIMMSMIKNMRCEHRVMNRCVSCQQQLPSGFLHVYVEFQRISLTGFRSCASRSQTGASQSRQSTESGVVGVSGVDAVFSVTIDTGSMSGVRWTAREESLIRREHGFGCLVVVLWISVGGSPIHSVNADDLGLFFDVLLSVDLLELQVGWWITHSEEDSSQLVLELGRTKLQIISPYCANTIAAWLATLGEGLKYSSNIRHNKGIPVMAISVISISSDSSEDSVGTPIGRVILFGTIPTTIPDTTPVITPPATQTDTPSDPSEDPSSDHIPPLPATSPFLSSDDDSTDSDTPDTPSSPTHDTPFTEITASTQRSPTIRISSSLLLASGQPIPYGRPYRYHLNGPVHMMTARKRVRPLPTHRLAERHPTGHSSSDSSSEASSDFHSDASSDPSSRHSLPDHSSPDLPGTSAGPSRKRRRSPMTSVPALSPVSGALSPVRADLIPSPKRVRDSGYLAEVEVDPRETSLRDDVIVRVSDEPHLEQDSDPEVQAEIDECFAYADALRDRGIDARVVVETIDRDETETGVRGPVEVRVERVTHPVMPEDIPEPAQEGAVEVTYETLGDLVQRFHDHTEAIPVHRIQTIEGVQREQGHRIVGVESAVMALTERIAELERDNRRLRGTMSVESQRVDRLQRGMSRMQRELRQMRRLRFYDRVRVGRLEAKMPSTRSGASMTREEFEELVARRVAEELEAREAARTLEPLNENGDELEGDNGGNGNGNGGNGMNGGK
ncbi:hypothetical protein Tco_1071194 [Tanacetum coccineum]|uniref:Uncharacterized protein n=1 Tax=Tanacetum coccineum TaxID=301880 RepID=A0ABQ5HNM1_9ASTR